MLVYFVFVLGIGLALKRYMHTSSDFFLAGRSIPAWVCGLAFISANLGAQEVIGMGASGAKYGIITSALLLDRCRPRHGLRRHLHDALLLRLESPLRPRVPAPPLRRKDPRPQRDLVCHHDRFLVGHQHVRHGAPHPDPRPLPRPDARRPGSSTSRSSCPPSSSSATSSSAASPRAIYNEVSCSFSSSLLASPPSSGSASAT